MIPRVILRSFCSNNNGDKYYNLYKSSYSDHMSNLRLSHVDNDGNASMVDISDKKDSVRMAEATASIFIGREAFRLVRENSIKKGDVLNVSQLAGILGAKKTSDLIPLCHPLRLNGIDVRLHLNENNHSIDINCKVKCCEKTGVEMEALTGASIAALTVYDMCKAVNKEMVISDIQLLSKSGGKSGDYIKKIA